MTEQQEPTVDVTALGLPEEIVDTHPVEPLALAEESIPTEESTTSQENEQEEEEENTLVLPVEPWVDFDETAPVWKDNPNAAEMVAMDDALVLPSVGYATMTGRLDERLNSVELDKSVEMATWAITATKGVESYTRDNVLQQVIERPGANWVHGISSQERKLTPIRTGAGAIRGNTPLTGILALAKATAFTTIGAIIRIPLPKSGIWVTIKAPTDAQLLEMERRIATDRVEFGRLTTGRVFAQSDVILKSHLIALSIGQCVESTYPDQNVDLRSVIKLPDLPLLITGLALSIYPNSFPLTRACLADPGKCYHIQRGDVSIAKLLRYDDTPLTEQQRLIFAKNQSRLSQKDFDDYHAGFVSRGKDVINYQDKLFITLRVPTLLEYQEMGSEWIAGLESSVDEAFGAAITPADRNSLINAKANATAMRQYSHWVERITYKNNGEVNGVVTDRQTIYESLERLSTNDSIAAAFYKGVADFVAEVTLGVVAIPSWVCPSCKKKQPQTGENFARLIAIDAASTFFTLLSHRVSQVHRTNGI